MVLNEIYIYALNINNLRSWTIDDLQEVDVNFLNIISNILVAIINIYEKGEIKQLLFKVVYSCGFENIEKLFYFSSFIY